MLRNENGNIIYYSFKDGEVIRLYRLGELRKLLQHLPDDTLLYNSNGYDPIEREAYVCSILWDILKEN